MSAKIIDVSTWKFLETEKVECWNKRTRLLVKACEIKANIEKHRRDNELK